MILKPYCPTPKEVYEAIVKLNLNAIPFVKGAKRPAIKVKPYLSQKFEGFKADIPERYNVAIVLGKISGLIGIDFDMILLFSLSIVQEIEAFKNLPMVITPNNGLHLYLPVEEEDLPDDFKGFNINLLNVECNKDGKAQIEIKGNGFTLLFPGSFVLTDNKKMKFYEVLLLSDETFSDWLKKFEQKFKFEEVLNLIDELLAKLEEKGFEYSLPKSLQTKEEEEKIINSQPNLQAKEEGRKEDIDREYIAYLQRLKAKNNHTIDLEKLKNLLEKHYIKGQRQFLVMATAGLLRKAGYTYEETVAFLYNLAKSKLDEEFDSQRIKAIEYTFKKSFEKVAGFTKLTELGIDPEELRSCFINYKDNTTDKKEEEEIDFDNYIKI